jgi:hypothetical protein
MPCAPTNVTVDVIANRAGIPLPVTPSSSVDPQHVSCAPQAAAVDTLLAQQTCLTEFDSSQRRSTPLRSSVDDTPCSKVRRVQVCLLTPKKVVKIHTYTPRVSSTNATTCHSNSTKRRRSPTRSPEPAQPHESIGTRVRQRHERLDFMSN